MGQQTKERSNGQGMDESNAGCLRHSRSFQELLAKSAILSSDLRFPAPKPTITTGIQRHVQLPVQATGKLVSAEDEEILVRERLLLQRIGLSSEHESDDRCIETPRVWKGGTAGLVVVFEGSAEAVTSCSSGHHSSYGGKHVSCAFGTALFWSGCRKQQPFEASHCYRASPCPLLLVAVETKPRVVSDAPQLAFCQASLEPVMTKLERCNSLVAQEVLITRCMAADAKMLKTTDSPFANPAIQTSFASG